MPRFAAAFLAFLALCSAPLAAQTGPWAKYDADLKGGALLREASAGNLAEVRSIVAGGADVNWGSGSGDSTPLMSAAMAGHLDVVDFLLEHGADPHVRWKFNGQTALEIARENDHADVVARLQGASAGLPPPGVRPPSASTPPAATPPPTRTPPRPPVAVAGGAGRGGWPAFGTYRVGDRVLWRQANGWFAGTISELGVPGPGRGRAEVGERKYRIRDDRWAGDGEWWDWGTVVAPERAAFWTDFFAGDWRLGEVMAVNARVEGAVETTTFSYAAASEALQVAADGRYRWKPLGAAEIRGRWLPAPDGPGIVLQRGVDGADWTLRNETNATDENIRGLQTARLTADGRMSIVATRPRR